MSRQPLILISAGGTGGGVYPALTIAEGLRRAAPETHLHFVGSVGGMEERLVPREQFAGYHAVQGGPLVGVSLPRRIVSLLKILWGVIQSYLLALRLRPTALVITGGWATFPPAVGCWLRGVPIVIYLPDIEPARVIRVISRVARLVLTPVPESAAFFRAGTPLKVVGYPLREKLSRATRADGIAYFQLDPALKTLLVWGGSRGAQRINEALGAILPELLREPVQVIHLSGEFDWETVKARREKLPAELQGRYRVFPYLKEEMGLALAAADLTVSRAGASCLGEYPHFGLPAILIPLAFAWRYQQVNADYLATRGAAVRLDDERLSEELLPLIRGLLGDPARLEAMSKACAVLSSGDAAARIASEVLAISGANQK